MGQFIIPQKTQAVAGLPIGKLNDLDQRLKVIENGGWATDEKVKYDANDASAGYLGAKTVAGTGITLSEGTGGDADKLKISTSFDIADYLTSATAATTYLKLDQATPQTVFNGKPSFARGITNTDTVFNIDSTTPSTMTASLAGAGAGNVDNGTHYYVVVFYNAFGRSVPSATASVNVTDNTTNGQVNLTNIPTSARADVVGRKIYRSAVNGSYAGNGKFYLLATIANNTATTYTDNIADSTINVVTNDVIFNSVAPNIFNASTWDSTSYYNSKKLWSITSNGDTLFYDKTYQNPFMFLDSVNGKLSFGNPERPKTTAIGANSIYVDSDVSNPSNDAMYIMPVGGTRLHIGSSSSKIYSINLAGVERFESYPALVTMSVSNNTHSFGAGTNSAISSSGNKDLVLTTGSGTGGVYLASSGASASSLRAFPFITYGANGDTYKWTGSHYYFNTYYNAANSGTDFPFHTKWLVAGTQIAGLDINGNFGIGTIPSYKFHLVGNLNAVNNSRLAFSEATVNDAGTGLNHNNFQATFYFNPSGDSSSNVNGYTSQILKQGNFNATGQLNVNYNSFGSFGSGTTSLVRMYYSRAGFENNSGAITNLYHFYATAPYGGGTGTIGSMYGLYLEDFKTAYVTNAWGVYQLGASVKNYFAGQVGIGTTTPDSLLHVKETRTNTLTANSKAYNVETTYNPAADSTYYWAAQKTDLYKDGSTNLTATIPLRAFYPSVENRGSGNVSGMAAGMLFVANSGTGTVTDAYGLYVFAPGASASNPITNYYGLYVGAAAKTGITNAYGFYSAGASDKNYFAGSVGIGTSTISAKTHIISTTEQLRLGYDASNYLSATIGSTGSATLALTGTSPTFTFSQGVTFSDGITIADAKNIALNTTTGTKIGTATTQKLGFWNTAPIAQPTTAVTAATFVANTSGIANDTATFDGYTIGQVVKALRNAGLLA